MQFDFIYILYSMTAFMDVSSQFVIMVRIISSYFLYLLFFIFLATYHTFFLIVDNIDSLI
jgi:hypothetical protein